MPNLSEIRCPTCGEKGLRAVARSVTTKAGKRTITVRGVAVEECPRCGERLYDPAALRKIREAREAAGGASAA
jgi:YgiT-type zinc finger domain-containing protein